MKEKGQKLKICAKKARAANKRRVAFLAKIAIHGGFILFTFLDNFWYQIYRNRSKKILCSRLALITLTKDAAHVQRMAFHF